MHYRWLSVLSALTVASFAGLATPLASPWNDVRVKHAWKAVPDNWESLGHPPLGTTTDLYVALKSHNEDALIDALYEVSTPGHPKYGAHFSKKGVAELVAPHTDTLELVYSWLAHHGVQNSSISTTHGGNWLTLTGVPVLQANELLGASYQLYRHTGTNDTAILRTVSYALPTVLHAHVETVAPTTFFASTRTLQQTPHIHPKAAPREPVTALSGRDETVTITPEYLRWLYKIYAYTPQAINRNALGFVGFGNEFPSPLDLRSFMSLFHHEAEDATFVVAPALAKGGWFYPSRTSLEANLNMQYAQAIAYPTPHIYYTTSGDKFIWSGSNEPAVGDLFLTWTIYVSSLSYVPQTIGISHGVYERNVPAEYAKSVCRLLALIGARGASVLFSSGDYGVGAGECIDNSGRVQFMPRFPASCPWLTSVGGTTSAGPEIAAGLSGGGFSSYFPIPIYQNVDVPTYLRRFGSQHRGLYNSSGRGIPDISAQALNFAIVDDASLHTVNGTICAVTTVVGIISLLNDYFVANGGTSLGFLNPLLYGYARTGLNDITLGSNPGCGTTGFSAKEGWDPVTGLGTPDFFTLVRLLYSEFVAPDNGGRGLPNSSDATISTRDGKEID